MQYYELAFLFYTGYYVLASALLLATLISAFLSTAKLHEIRLELFKSVDKRGLSPLVHQGRVRFCTALAHQTCHLFLLSRLLLLLHVWWKMHFLFKWYSLVLKACILTFKIYGCHHMASAAFLRSCAPRLLLSLENCS